MVGPDLRDVDRVERLELGARPFLKWAGGKGQLLREIVPRLDRALASGQYHEPFVGGGAVFFEMQRTRRLRGRAVLCDRNPNLVEVYAAVRDEVDELVALLERHKLAHNVAHYYAARAVTPERPVERAARVVYLNKTCFNGLYRENSKGQFNVPIGKYIDPPICDEENLRLASSALRDAELRVASFEAVLDHAVAGDLVYFDPPYVPVSATSSFVAYAKGGFGENDQAQLADVFVALDRRGVRVLLSNSMTPRVQDLYGQFHIDVVMASRSVNRDGAGRGKIPEALVRNF